MTAVTPLAIPLARSIEETEIQSRVTYQIHLATRRMQDAYISKWSPHDRDLFSPPVRRSIQLSIELANQRRYYSALRRLAESLALTVGKADPEYAECMADVERADDFHSLIRQRLHVSR